MKVPLKASCGVTRLMGLLSIVLINACSLITASADEYTGTQILKFIQEDYNDLHNHPLNVADGTVKKGSYDNLETHPATSYSPIQVYASTGNFTVAVDNKDINGRDFWYPYATLGTQYSGATLTMTFSPSAKNEYGNQTGVYVNKVVIKGCGNKFTKDPAKIRVNGIEQEVPYTETPESGQGKIQLYDLTFDFGLNNAIETLSIEAPSTGISFNSIEVYSIRTRELSFGKNRVDVLFPEGKSLKLAAANATIDGETVSFLKLKDHEIGTNYLYEVLYADGTSAGTVTYEDVVMNTGIYTDVYFTPAEEGLYTVRTYMAPDSGYYGEASYLLNIYSEVPETLTFNSGTCHDGIISLYDRHIDKDGKFHDNTNVSLDGLPEGADVYYRVWDDPDFPLSQDFKDDDDTPYRPQISEQRASASAADAADISDMTRYDPAKGIDMSKGDTIDLVYSKNGSLSPVQRFRYQTINVPVGVETLQSPDRTATYYHIDGRRAGKDTKGLLIRVNEEGRTSKILRR